MTVPRRTVLQGASALGLSWLAGCASPEFPEAGGGSAGYASFFALWDWCEHLAGEDIEFQTPIPDGRAGHGYDPEGDLVRDIASTAVFVYLDTPEFRWAQDVAEQLEADYSDIRVIDGLAGLQSDQLLGFDADPPDRPDRDHDWDPDTLDVAEFDVFDRRAGEVSAYWHQDHWHGGIHDIPVDGDREVEAIVRDASDRVAPIGPDEPFQLDARLAPQAPTDIVEIRGHGDRVEFVGQSPGRTLVIFELLADGTVIWESDADAIDIEVVESAETAELDAFADPHVWVDPILATDIVDTLASELAHVIPDHAEEIDERATSYGDELARIDEAFETMMERADRRTAVFAGHDSFRYLEHRYGFTLHSPTGVSPDRRPSQADIAETIELIEDEGIDAILYDPFETPDPDEEIPPLAETLIESVPDRDMVALPLTPVEGTTPEWNEHDWGWVEQMEEINLSSLTQALGAD